MTDSLINTLLSDPSSLFALIGLLILILGFLRIKHTKITTHTLVYIALMLALSVILHMIRLFHMPQGGSVTLGAMVPLLLISFRYGSGVGYLTGFAYGLISLLQDPFILQPVQVLFDYPLPYMVLGIAGYFRKNIYLGAILAVLARLACHFISGVVFFSQYAPAGMSPYIYSLLFNASYLIPELVICVIILRILPTNRLLSAMKD